jgi:hypothetical protein
MISIRAIHLDNIPILMYFPHAPQGLADIFHIPLGEIAKGIIAAVLFQIPQPDTAENYP